MALLITFRIGNNRHDVRPDVAAAYDWEGDRGGVSPREPCDANSSTSIPSRGRDVGKKDRRVGTGGR